MLAPQRNALMMLALAGGGGHVSSLPAGKALSEIKTAAGVPDDLRACHSVVTLTK